MHVYTINMLTIYKYICRCTYIYVITKISTNNFGNKKRPDWVYTFQSEFYHA